MAEPKKVPNSNLHLLLGRGYRLQLSQPNHTGWRTIFASRNEERIDIHIDSHPLKIHGTGIRDCLDELHNYLRRWRKALNYPPRD